LRYKEVDEYFKLARIRPTLGKEADDGDRFRLALTKTRGVKYNLMGSDFGLNLSG
jgi:hypothetical protein